MFSFIIRWNAGQFFSLKSEVIAARRKEAISDGS